MELLVIFLWILCTAGAPIIAQERGGNVILWAFLGFLFGPLAVLLAFFVNGGKRMTKRKCPFCAEEISPEAIKCKHCASELPAEALKA